MYRWTRPFPPQDPSLVLPIISSSKSHKDLWDSVRSDSRTLAVVITSDTPALVNHRIFTCHQIDIRQRDNLGLADAALVKRIASQLAPRQIDEVN